MLLPLMTLALLGATPCNLSLLAPATPAFRQASTPALLQDGCSDPLAPAPSARPRWQRSTFTFLGSALGAAAGAVGGGLLGYALAGDCSSDGCWFGPPGLWLGALIGLPLGAGLGAHVTGEALGGEGQWWSTLLGTAAGTALSLLLLSIVSNDEEAAPVALAAPFLPSVGALVGYELGQRPASALPGCAQLPAPRGPLLSLRVAF